MSFETFSLGVSMTRSWIGLEVSHEATSNVKDRMIWKELKDKKFFQSSIPFLFRVVVFCPLYREMSNILISARKGHTKHTRSIRMCYEAKNKKRGKKITPSPYL